MPLRIATWNIHRGVGTDGREDLLRIHRVLDELAPDVIGLQEVGYQSLASKAVAQELADGLDATLIAGVTLSDAAGDYGNALLTRLPVESLEVRDLSVAGREPRGLIDVRMRAGDASLRVLNTHLGLKAAERRFQLEQVHSQLSQRAADVDVLLGDFNEWFFYSRGIRRLDRLLASTPRRQATFPSRRPLLALDRIWARPATVFGRVSVHRSPLARIASDHLPLVAEIDIAGLRRGAPSARG